MSAHVNPVFPDVDTSFMADAACKGRGDLFFPSGAYSESAVKRVCRSCPVRWQCRDYARALPAQPEGVWGGLNAAEMRELRAIRRERQGA